MRGTITFLLCEALILEVIALAADVEELFIVTSIMIAVAIALLCIAVPRGTVVFLWALATVVAFAFLGEDSWRTLALWVVGICAGVPVLPMVVWINEGFKK